MSSRENNRQIRRILSIDGGGIKGTMPAACLAGLEEDLGEPIGRYDIGRTLLVHWRRQYRSGALMGGTSDAMRFMPVKVAPPEVSTPEPEATASAGDRVKVVLTNGRRLTVAASIDPAALARFVQVLDLS